MMKLRLRYIFILFLGLGLSSFQHNYAMNNDFVDFDDSDESMEEIDQSNNSSGKSKLPVPDPSIFEKENNNNNIYQNNITIQNNNNTIENNNSFKSPERFKPEELASGLTPQLSSIKLSPFGLKTPERYKNKNSQSSILDLFISNFLGYEKEFPDNSLFKLVSFLFEKKGGQVFSKNIKISEETFEKISQDCIDFVSKSFDMNFFNLLYSDICLVIENNKKLSDEIKSKKEVSKKNKGCNIREKIYYFVMSLIKNKSGLYNALFATHRNNNAKNLYKVKNEKVKNDPNWIFLNALIDSFQIILTTELYKKHYWELCPYILGHYLNKLSKVKKLKIDFLDQDSNGDEHIDKKQKTIKNNENSDKNDLDENSDGDMCMDKKKTMIQNNQDCDKNEIINQSCFFSKLFAITEKESNNEKIITAISQTPLYYLLCFDMTNHEIEDIIIHIVDQKHSGYKNADTEKKSLLFEVLIDRLLATKDHPCGITKSLSLAYLSIINNLATMKINANFGGEECNVYKSQFKPFICSALKIARLLKYETQMLKNCIFIDIDHISCVTFAPGKKVFGGGHLDLDAKIFDEDLQQQNQGFSLLKKCELGTASSGIKIVDWLLAEQSNNNRCFSNKMSTLFPDNIKKENIHLYVETIYNAIISGGTKLITVFKKLEIKKIPQIEIKEAQTVCDLENTNNDIFSNSVIMCECDTDFIPGAKKMRVVVCLDYCYIDKNSSNKDDKDNLIPLIKTMYPCGALYFTRDKDGKVFFDGELIDNQEKLNQCCKGLLRYKRNNDKSICYLDGNIAEYEPLTLQLETLKKIKTADDSFRFERDNDLKVIVEVIQNICCIEIFVKDTNEEK